MPENLKGLSKFGWSVALILKATALKQNGEPLWKFNGPGAHYLYNLTPEGRAVFGVSDKRISRKRLLSLRDRIPQATANQRLRPLASALHRGDITVDQFRAQARDAIKQAYIGQYALARGGREGVTFADWGRIGGLVKRQYGSEGYLERFINDYQTEQGQQWSERYMTNRLGMYAEASTQAFEWGQAAMLGLPPNPMWDGRPLPQFPGDGRTECLCILSPESRVLTSEGWKPLGSVRVGDLVWTHRNRFRKVLATIIKSSDPQHREVTIQAPTGRGVRATDNHLWFTEDGWLDSNDIHRYNSTVETVSVTALNGVQDVEAVSELWGNAGKPGENGYLYEMPSGMQMREVERPSGFPMSVVPVEAGGIGSVDRSGEASEEIRRDSQGHEGQAHHVFGSVLENKLASETVGQSAVRLVLGRGSETNNLSVPVVVDNQSRFSSGWVGYSSQERNSLGRSAIQFGANGIGGSRQTPRTSDPHGDKRAQSEDMRQLRRDVFPSQPERSGSQILFGELLPPGTAVYDLTVEEDESFCIEGLFAHNSRCRCHWSIHEFDDHYQCYWVIDPGAEHCVDCLTNQFNWSPLRIAKVSSTEEDLLAATVQDRLYTHFGIQEGDYTQEEQSLLRRVLELRDPAPEEAQEDESLWDVFWRVLREDRPIAAPSGITITMPDDYDYIQRAQEQALYDEQLREQGIDNG